MKKRSNWSAAFELCAIALLQACSSSNDNTTTTGTGGAQSLSTGGASNSAAGGSQSAGGNASSGGSGNATGGTSNAIGGTASTGGASATGGSEAIGGTSAATGGANSAGGTGNTGGSTSQITCSVDDATSDANFYGTTNFCTPSNPDLNLITGTLAISSLNISAANGTITLSGSVPMTGPLTLARPFNQDPCTTSGLDATVTGSNPPQQYTGISFTIQNTQAASTTLVVYLADRVVSNSTSYYVLGTANITVAGNSTVTQTVTWSDLTTSCSMGSGTSFDPTQILAIGLGFTQTGSVGLTISSVSFSTS